MHPTLILFLPVKTESITTVSVDIEISNTPILRQIHPHSQSTRSPLNANMSTFKPSNEDRYMLGRDYYASARYDSWGNISIQALGN